MIHKEEDTALLLSQDEQPADDQCSVKYVKKNSFIAATFAASCLCGAGIFISTDKGWSRETGVPCKETDLLRFCLLIGGILSAVISGRAVDFYGRRSSMIFAAVGWLIASVFLMLLPFLETNSQSVLNDIPSQNLNSHQTAPSQLTSTHLFNSSEKYNSVSQSSVLNLHSLPTVPLSVHSLPSEHSVPDLNLPQVDRSNAYITNPLCEHARYDASINSKCLDMDEKLYSLLPHIICNLFIGAASSASVISASTYVFEISQPSIRARCISISDFFSIIFGLFLPVMHSHVLVLTVAACLPVIVLAILLLLPINFPNYLSLPSSPYHLILQSVIQRRKLYSNNNAGNVDETTGKQCTYNFFSNLSNSFEKTAFSFTHILKVPSKTSSSKVYDVNSRKNSAGESDDGSFCMNDVAKQSEMKLEFDKLQEVCLGNQAVSDATNCQRVHFEESSQVFSGESVRSMGEISSSKEMERSDPGGDPVAALGGEDKSALLEGSNFECEEWSEGVLTREGRGRFKRKKGSPQRMEACKTLSYLHGASKGEEEAEAIHKDIDSDDLHTDASYFTLDMKNFQPIIHSVLKIGFPLIILHICATSYEDVIVVSEAVMSKLRFCGTSVTTAEATLKVMSATLSILLLDKIGHQQALLGAAAILATSSLVLGFLSPHIVPAVGDLPSVTDQMPPSAPLPTLYPLLPTPLPQVLHREYANHMESEWKNAHLFTQRGRVLNIYIAPESPMIWLTLLPVVCFIVSGTLVLAPLTRLTLLSAFPTHNRGSGVGISFALLYSVHLVVFLLPCTFHSSTFKLMFRSGACFSSIFLLLCFLSIRKQTQSSGLQRYSCNRRFFHLLTDGKVCNMSLANSTAV